MKWSIAAPSPAPQRLETKSESQSAIKYYERRKSKLWPKTEHIQEEYIRQSSIRTVAGVAIVAVGSGYFLSGPDTWSITRSNHYRQEHWKKAKRRARETCWRRVKELMLDHPHDYQSSRGFHLWAIPTCWSGSLPKNAGVSI